MSANEKKRKEHQEGKRSFRKIKNMHKTKRNGHSHPKKKGVRKGDEST